MPSPAKYGIDAAQVHPYLHQGAKPPEGNAVRDAGYAALVLCAKEHQGGRYNDVMVFRCSLNDDEEEHLLLPSEWNRARAMAHVVAVLLRDKQHVLVTCAQGRNRSGLVSCMAMHLVTGWPGSRCVARVRRARANALTNDSFVEALDRRL